MYCTKCGNKIEANSTFCIRCGNKVKSVIDNKPIQNQKKYFK